MTSDDLELRKTSFPEIPEDVIFPDELNRFHRAQIQYLVHENGMLKKNLSEYEAKCKKHEENIKETTKKRAEEKLSLTNEFASTKIVELSKKIRDKTCETESLKTKCSKLESYIFELKKDKSQMESEVVVEKPVECKSDLKKMEEKVSHLSVKLSESKNSNLQLKNDLKLANKWLQQEIGESFEALSLLNSNTNWRGRSQIICDLQQKNSELKEKLKEKGPTNEHSTSIRALKSKYENNITTLAQENASLRSNCEDLKKKTEGIKARYQVLENELMLVKTRYEMMSKQSERDQNVISTFSGQLASVRDLRTNALKQKDQAIEKLHKENDRLAVVIKTLECRIENLEKTPEEKAQVKESETNKLLQEEIISLKTEKLKLVELLERQTNRTITERNSLQQTQLKLRGSRQKVARLEAKITQTDLEQSGSKLNSYRSGFMRKSSSDNLKNQLELADEQIKVLTTRLETEQLERKVDLKEFSKLLKGDT